MSSPKGKTRNAAWVALVVALLASAASAQMKIGDGVSLSLSGNLGYGYSGSFGNTTQSAHAQNLVGSMEGRGYYFHPNFLSFQFSPYWDRSQSNSDSQFLSHSSGVGGSVSLFGGSRFPGSISYSKDFSSTSEFRVAGVPTLGGEGSGQSFGIGWSAVIPNAPSLTASYSVGSAEASLLGGGARTASHSRNLLLTSSYQWWGFSFSGDFSHSTGGYDTPAELFGTASKGDTSSTAYGLTASHPLPLRGSIGFGWSHSDSTSNGSYSADYGGSNYSISNSFNPWNRLSVFQNLSYNTNLYAQFAKTVLNDSLASVEPSISDAHGLYYGAGSSYYVGKGINIGGYFNHRMQTFGKKTYSDSQYGGNLHFNHQTRLFGFLTFGVGVVDTASQAGNSGAGLTANVNMSRRFHGWETAADFDYSQSVMTLGSIMTTSNYSYGGSIRRRFSKELAFGGSYREARSGIVTREGDGSVSHSYSGNLQFRRYSLSSSYSQADGTAVLNSSGTLTPVSGGSLLVPELMLFNARSFSIGGGTTLLRRISVSGAYSRFKSSTGTALDSTMSSGDRYSAQMHYRLRKFQISGSYGRSMQSVSTLAGGPRMVNSYFLSISRWFNVF